MKKITVNVWGGGKERDGVTAMRLVTAGCKSAKIVPPWNAAGTAWAFEVVIDDVGLDFDTNPAAVPLTVGWLLGIIGTPMNVEVDFSVVQT